VQASGAVRIKAVSVIQAPPGDVPPPR